MRYISSHRQAASGAALALAVILIFTLVSSPAVVGVSASRRSLPVYSVERDGKYAALTFDAAWGNEDTEQLIDILTHYGVRATFFVVGGWVDKYPESVRALADAGMEVMNHSNTHAHFASLSAAEVVEDVNACSDKVESVTGVRPTLFRCPYGEYDDEAIDAIRGIINDKRDYADLRLLQEMCRGERYGVDKFGSIARVEKITNQTLFRYYQELLSTAHLELFYCGSAERERVEEAISRAFAPLQRGRVVPPVIAEKKNAPETPREITERMDVTQGRLSMGWRASTNDAPAMMLANLIFGGYSNSKLFLNVREKLSLCYYASSAYHRSKGIVTVSSGIECRDVETAKREILAQLASVQRGEFEEWEVEGARACLIASLESRGDSAGRMEENALGQAATGIRETADELIAALRAVTNERIAEAAQSMTLDTVYFLTGEDSKDE